MRKITTVALALVIALVSLTMGYAYWTETLYINGNVTTGELDVKWVDFEFGKHDIVPWAYAPNSPYVESDADVSGDRKTIFVTFGNLYPGAVIDWGGFGWNSGSIPAKFQEMKITVESDPNNVADDLYVVPGGWLTPQTYVTWDRDGLLNFGDILPSIYRPVAPNENNVKFLDLDDRINAGMPKFILNPASRPGNALYAGYFGLGKAPEGPVIDENGNELEIEDGRCIRLRVGPEAPENSTLQFKIEFVFGQVNAS